MRDPPWHSGDVAARPRPGPAASAPQHWGVGATAGAHEEACAQRAAGTIVGPAPLAGAAVAAVGAPPEARSRGSTTASGSGGAAASPANGAPGPSTSSGGSGGGSGGSDDKGDFNMGFGEAVVVLREDLP
jgi:hypothetical protein